MDTLLQNATEIAKPNYDGALFSHIRNGGVALMWDSIPVDLTGVFMFIRENIGIFQSVSGFCVESFDELGPAYLFLRLGFQYFNIAAYTVTLTAKLLIHLLVIVHLSG